MESIEIFKLAKNELQVLQFKIQTEIFKRKIIAIQKVINHYTGPVYIKQKADILANISKKEINNHKRLNVIEQYITELEVILNLDDCEDYYV